MRRRSGLGLGLWPGSWVWVVKVRRGCAAYGEKKGCAGPSEPAQHGDQGLAEVGGWEGSWVGRDRRISSWRWAVLPVLPLTEWFTARRWAGCAQTPVELAVLLLWAQLSAPQRSRFFLSQGSTSWLAQQLCNSGRDIVCRHAASWARRSKGGRSGTKSMEGSQRSPAPIAGDNQNFSLRAHRAEPPPPPASEVSRPSLPSASYGRVPPSPAPVQRRDDQGH